MATLSGLLALASGVSSHGRQPFAVKVAAGGEYTPARQRLSDVVELETFARCLLEGSGSERLDIGVTFAAQTYASVVSGAMAAGLVAAGAVPLLDIDHLRLRDLSEPSFLAATPDTPVMRARPVVALWDALETHLAVLVPTLARLGARPQRALWRVSHDAVANAFVTVGEAFGRREQAWSLWERAAACAPRLLRGRARPTTARIGDRDVAIVERHGCCLAYRCPAYGVPCGGCPLARRRREAVQRERPRALASAPRSRA